LNCKAFRIDQYLEEEEIASKVEAAMHSLLEDIIAIKEK
jgi:hypothetical protein